MGGLDVVRAEVEVDFVNAVASALVVDEGARAELGDGEEARAGDEFVAAFALAAGGHIGGEGQAREVVARQETLSGEVAVGVEIALVNAFGLREQANLAFGLRPQAAGMIALGFGTGMVAENFVVKFALADGGAVKLAPTVAGGIEGQFDLVEDLARPVFVKPSRARELVADAINELVGLGEGSGPVRGAAQFGLEQVFDRERRPCRPRDEYRERS